MADAREALQKQGQEAGFGPRGIDSQFPDDSQLQQWRETVGLPENIPLTPITVNRWQASPDGLAIAAGLAAGAVVFGGDSKTPSKNDANPSDQSSEPLLPRAKMSRRAFLRWTGITAAGTALAACMPSSSPQPRPTEGQPGAAPTPTVDINPNLLASLKTDTNFVDSQTWGRRTFGPQMDALARQFSPERVRSMRMNVTSALGEGNKLLGYAFDVFEGAKRYLYFGSDSIGSNGAFVAIPGTATIALANGVEIGFPINQKQDRFVHKYVDSAGNYLDPRMGMMVGAGSGVTVNTSEINSFLSDIAEPVSTLVKSEVFTKKDDQALFTLKVKYDEKGEQLFGVFEEVNGKGETSIYVISKKTGIHKLEQVQGYTYLLNKTTGEIELYQDGQLAGRVKSVGSTGQVTPEIPGVATATPKATDTLASTATATITLTPTPTATPRPTEIPTPLFNPEISLIEGRMRNDDGKILEGAVSTHFMHTRYGGLTYFMKDIKTMKEWGANSINILWNAGYLNNDKYLSDLTQAIEATNRLGMKVVLTLHSRGEEPIPNTNRTKEAQIIKVDQQLVTDWSNLLTNSKYGKRITAVVGSYGIVSEAFYDYDGNRPTNATKLVGIYNQAYDAIKASVGRDVIYMYSPPNYGRQMDMFIDIPPSRKNVVIDAHVYNGGDPPLSANWQNYILQVLNKGYGVYIGEAFWGGRDTITVAQNKLSFFQQNNIPFAAWGLDSSSNDPNHLINTTNGISPYGNLLKQALNTLNQ